MVAFIVGNSDPSSPILTTADMPGAQGAHDATRRAESGQSAEAAAEPGALPPPSQGLIPGLPDDMARKCLARVPFWYHARSKVVSKAWRDLYSSPEIVDLRKSEGVEEEYLLCFDNNPSVCAGQLYHPATGKWRKIPPTPVELHCYGLKDFGVVVLRQQVYLIGGVLYDARAYPTDSPVPSKDVFRYDVVGNSWHKMAPMIDGRGSPACAVMTSAEEDREGGGKILVAGGDGKYATNQRRWTHISTAEEYDVKSNEWIPLPDMNSFRACSSAVCTDGKFAVLGGYGAPRLISGFLQVCEQLPDSEIYSADANKWTRRKLLWFPDDKTCTGPVTQLNGKVFMLSGSAILRLELSCGAWSHETSLDWADRDASFYSLAGELHVVPSDKVTSKFQLHYAYNPTTQKWRTAKVARRLRYLRSYQACRSPLRAAVVLRL